MPRLNPNDGLLWRRQFFIRAAVLCAAAPFAAAASAEIRPVLVFAAASLKNALDVIAGEWRAATGGRPMISYAASSTLAKQIENGAPADLFISADQDWMDSLQQRRLIDPKTRVDLLGNSLVLIAPADSAAQVAIAPGFPLAAMLGDAHLAMADPDAVPAGRYGKAALSALGVWPQVAGHIAAAENVRAALLLVARGEAPFGIVYRTDASAEPAVRIVGTFPPESHPPIVYPMALTPMAMTSASPEAPALAAYLRGPAARTLFEAQGFTVSDPAR